jgi:hypothetical protein
MYLAVMLIIVSILVFYNEYNKTMNIAEIGLLIVALVAIVRASMNYIHLNDTAGLKNIEGFISTARNTNSRKSSNKSKGKNKNNDVIVLESSRSKEYFDTDNDMATAIDVATDIKRNTPQTTQHMLASLEGNKIDTDAVNQVNSLLGISSPQMQSRQQSNFKNIPTTTRASGNNSGIESVFSPQIQIGKGAFDSLAGADDVSMQGMNMTSLGGLGVPDVASLASTAAALGVGDNMSFPNTMKPTSNLWSSDLDYMDMSKNWSQSLADYNKGKWNPNTYAKASDYIDYYTPSAYGMNTPPNTDAIGIGSATSSSSSSKASNTGKSQFENITSATTTQPTTTQAKTQPTTLDSNGQPRKLCGAYDDLSLDLAGNLVVQNYTQAKKWMPGYTYVPPVYWDVPQKHASPCSAANPNARKLTGLVDRGLPINALELNPDGTMADTEDTVSLTNVGSIIPRFNYQETPFSKPYV